MRAGRDVTDDAGDVRAVAVLVAAAALPAPVKSRLSASPLRTDGCRASTPVSITATPMPRPVKPRSPSYAPRQTWSAPIASAVTVDIVRTGTSPDTLETSVSSHRSRS